MKQLLKENSKWKNVGWFFRILFMIFALTPGCLTTLSDGLDGLHVEMVFLTMGVGAVCWITKDESLRKNRWLHVLCAFFAFTTVMGTSYHEQGSWNYVFGNFAQFLLALVVMAGYYNLYESLIALGAYVSEHWEGVRRREIKGKIENFIFEAHPFWSTFAIAMLCALPYMISFFPGPIQADAFEQVWKYMGIIENSNKHPVVSTVIMGRCLAFGRVVLGSDNLGIFTYTLIQSLLQAVGISYLVCVMKKMKAPVWIRWFGLLFLTVFPLFPMWGFTMVKDAQYYISLLYFGVSFADILVDGTEKKKWWKQIVFLCASYGMILCRKEGRYLLVCALICLFFYHKKQWKLYLFTAVTGFMILFYIEQIYMPAHDIEEGRLAEGLSAPIQQTARYQRDHGAEVTEEERAILSELFDDYDQMGTAHYSPEISDAAKDQMISHPTKEQLKNYFKVWFAQFCKHPDTYFQAFFNQTYGYFYTDRKDRLGTPIIETTVGREQLSMEEFYMEIGFPPQLKGMREFLIGMIHFVTQFPLISLLYNAGFHGYLLLGYVVYLLGSKKGKRILLIVPTLLVFAVCILSPVNGELRYMLPVMIMLPLNLTWCAYQERESVAEKEEK